MTPGGCDLAGVVQEQSLSLILHELGLRSEGTEIKGKLQEQFSCSLLFDT